MPSLNHEIEITFVLAAVEPMAVLARLETANRLADFSLRHRAPEDLRDVYLDLPERRLRQRGYALRVRHLGDRWLLCLKGRSRHRGIAVQRLELEGDPTDPELRTRIRDELGNDWPAALAPTNAAMGDRSAGPLPALQSAGFSPIQDRRTLRRPRDVLGIGNEALAVLAIDTVIYVVEGTPFRHHEVEIEAAMRTDDSTMDDIARALAATCPELQPWRPSKLATGLALEALVRHQRTLPITDSEGNLLPQSYSLLLEWLRPHHNE
ncbi:MAG TPA: CYTH domain-containing protein [Candidatus Krumholzibacteria bacterium]|nr:CYTH domain-containing protein [Candidatus Krumholzibacteria bacterium]